MKIVLAYSGGLDTSVIVKWLKETYDADIITFAADVGQEEELKGLDKKAVATVPPSITPSISSRNLRATISTR